MSSAVAAEIGRLGIGKTELAGREGQAVALVWREAAVEALRCALVAFDALCEEAAASVH